MNTFYKSSPSEEVLEILLHETYCSRFKKLVATRYAFYKHPGLDHTAFDPWQ
jgi:hypothetical protein